MDRRTSPPYVSPSFTYTAVDPQEKPEKAEAAALAHHDGLHFAVAGMGVRNEALGGRGGQAR